MASFLPVVGNSLQNLYAEEGIAKWLIADETDGLIVCFNPLDEPQAKSLVLAKEFNAILRGIAMDQHHIIRWLLLKTCCHRALPKADNFGRIPHEIFRGINPSAQIIDHRTFWQDGQRSLWRRVFFHPVESRLDCRTCRLDLLVEGHETVMSFSHGQRFL